LCLSELIHSNIIIMIHSQYSVVSASRDPTNDGSKIFRKKTVYILNT
jgi:hypothetical protein